MPPFESEIQTNTSNISPNSPLYGESPLYTSNSIHSTPRMYTMSEQGRGIPSPLPSQFPQLTHNTNYNPGQSTYSKNQAELDEYGTSDFPSKSSERPLSEPSSDTSGQPPLLPALQVPHDSYSRSEDNSANVSYQSIPGLFLTTSDPSSSPILVSSNSPSTVLPLTPTVRETHHITLNYDPYNRKTLLNHYEIFQELGRGQHGKVRLACDLETDEYVAIKVVDRVGKPRLDRLTSGASQEEKIKREIAILKKCIHPHIVRLREVMDDIKSRKIYLVLEYCQKGELQWKNPDTGEPSMTPDKARSTFRDLLLGVEFLHFQGIIHRDIKPANLLLSEDNVVKISDFGVSYASSIMNNNQDDEIELAKTAGTPAFFAPELCILDMDAPRKPITKKIDIWALGVTLYCFLFGKVPFTADSEYNLFKVISTQPVYFPDDEEFYANSEETTVPSRFLFDLPPDNSENSSTKPNKLFIPADLEDYNLSKDLINKLLEKNPDSRIEMSDIKRHSWVTKNMTAEQFTEFLRFNNSFVQTPINVSHEETKSAVTNITITHRIRKRLSKIGNTALHFAGLGLGRRKSVKDSESSIASMPDYESIDTDNSPSSHGSIESFYEFDRPSTRSSPHTTSDTYNLKSVKSRTSDGKNPYLPLTPTLLSTQCNVSDIGQITPMHDEECDTNNNGLSRHTSKSCESTKTTRSYNSEAESIQPPFSPFQAKPVKSPKSPVKSPKSPVKSPKSPMATGALESLNNIIQRSLSNSSGRGSNGVSRSNTSTGHNIYKRHNSIQTSDPEPALASVQSPQFSHPPPPPPSQSLTTAISYLPKINTDIEPGGYKDQLTNFKFRNAQYTYNSSPASPAAVRDGGSRGIGLPRPSPFGNSYIHSSFIADVMHDDDGMIPPRPISIPSQPRNQNQIKNQNSLHDSQIVGTVQREKETDFPQYFTNEEDSEEDNGELTLVLGPRKRADSMQALVDGESGKARSKSSSGGFSGLTKTLNQPGDSESDIGKDLTNLDLAEEENDKSEEEEDSNSDKSEDDNSPVGSSKLESRVCERPKTTSADGYGSTGYTRGDDDLRQNLFKTRLLKQVGVDVNDETVGKRKRGNSIAIGQLQRPKALFDL
ncbi:kinase-like protein [Nadsonia fulvescens var. elongata DSM 6958]|uniref:Kinase-like protein n=1 Tax=Nadsonia fulvescens var. elongata DSM 6958 TaxID=857566 RepID=A0A1E3PL82_9ASCO|nr:kinase-like protein [Nadsonia fulvescens var. elongata DSM 6958]